MEKVVNNERYIYILGVETSCDETSISNCKKWSIEININFNSNRCP